MLMFLATNWKTLLIIVATTMACYLLHAVDVNRIEAQQRAALVAQQAVDVLQCNADKRLTREANDALQKDRDDLTARLAALKLQHPETCVPVTRSAHVQHRKARPAGRDERGLSSDWLLDFSARQCSSYWRQLRVCDKFLTDERKVSP